MPEERNSWREVAKELARRFAQSSEAADFRRAEEAMWQDPQASELLQQLRQAQTRQALGNQEAAKEVERLTDQVMDLPIVADFVQAQDRISRCMREISAMIAKELAFPIDRLDTRTGDSSL
ncbi:MAG: YlbF family regulator [Firmicutes bacterium]|nr:YlbF family regulator [Bacillota bacterium]